LKIPNVFFFFRTLLLKTPHCIVLQATELKAKCRALLGSAAGSSPPTATRDELLGWLKCVCVWDGAAELCAWLEAALERPTGTLPPNPRPTDNCPQPKETLPAVSTLTLPY
jgi:hypothetical protein